MKKKISHIIFIAFVLLLPVTVHADRVKVRLFSNNTISTIYVSFDLGEYNLYGDDRLLSEVLGEGKSVEIKPAGADVQISVDGYNYGSFHKARLEATDTACILCLNPSGVKQRTYEGNLIVSTLKSGSLLIINDVEFETYLAGVVQSEIYGNYPDIFRVQAIIARTWALRNINKHSNDGYNFCDHVHCQAYHNRCIRPDIMLGTMASSGETVVDKDGHLIETPFHSNSGGQTANSEDVWRNAVPYLRSVPDTFSYHMKQTDWTKTISQDKWLNYFQKTHKLDITNPDIKKELLTFTQEERKSKICGVSLTRVRTDFQLKSTFFNVEAANGNVIIHGHGYGHGVGLSQEGTIRMVGLGISYDSIIRHYYTGAFIHHDAATPRNYVENYVRQIEKIIEEDKLKQTQVRSKKDDWLGRLFRVRDREDREEVYDEKQESDSEWKYDW